LTLVLIELLVCPITKHTFTVNAVYAWCFMVWLVLDSSK
jgi:uncharacterized protein YbaR (Trm112 family)